MLPATLEPLSGQAEVQNSRTPEDAPEDGNDPEAQVIPTYTLVTK